MKKLLSVTLVIVAAVGNLYGQQDPQFSQNMYNKLYVNPAFAGASGGLCGTLLYRNQWTGFEGAPQTGLISVDAAVNPLHGGLGLTVMAADELGFENTLMAKLAYAFRFNLGSGEMAIGVDAGFMQKSLDGDFVFNDPGDNVIPEGSVSGSLIPDLGAGLYYSSDKLYIGASMSHITEGEIEYDNFTSELARHYYGMIGYRIDFTPSLSLTPSVFVKNVASETQVDANANLMINERIWVGGSYRIDDAIVVLAGINITPNLRLGYSYDITTSDLKDSSDGTHEIMLGYCYYFKPKVTPILRNVRFL
jgi:type IX secretion system PorP/SprF family membrane protein